MGGLSIARHCQFAFSIGPESTAESATLQHVGRLDRRLASYTYCEDIVPSRGLASEPMEAV